MLLMILVYFFSRPFSFIPLDAMSIPLDAMSIPRSVSKMLSLRWLPLRFDHMTLRNIFVKSMPGCSFQMEPLRYISNVFFRNLSFFVLVSWIRFFAVHSFRSRSRFLHFDYIFFLHSCRRCQRRLLSLSFDLFSIYWVVFTINTFQR